MSAIAKLKLFLAAAAVMLVLDFAWLAWISTSFYERHLGHLLRPEPVLPAIVLFYLLYVAGIVVFAVLPGLRMGSPLRSWLLGVFLGLVAYGTFDLTSYAAFAGFPGVVVLVDLLWGSILTSTVAVVAHVFGRHMGVERAEGPPSAA